LISELLRSRRIRKQYTGPDVSFRPDPPETLARLARVAGCPTGAAPIPWLAKRGLIERVAPGDGGFRFKTSPGPTIKIIRGAEIDGPKGEAGPRRHGIFEYHCPTCPLVRGCSRQPLLDACRQLSALYGLTKETAGVFRQGSELADISCRVEDGAQLTVVEPSRGRIHFGKYVKFESSAWNDRSVDEPAADLDAATTDVTDV